MNTNFLDRIDEYIRQKRYRLINSVLVYENGELAFERYYNNRNAQSRNQIKSVWKSVLSLTLGVCVDKGWIGGVDEPIGRYLPEFALNIYPYHKSITIRHLLTMSSGIYWSGGVHYHCPMLDQMRRSQEWVEHIAEVRPAYYPGTKFVYKEWDVILLSALIGRAYSMAHTSAGSVQSASNHGLTLSSAENLAPMPRGDCASAALDSPNGKSSDVPFKGSDAFSAWDVCSEYIYKPLGISSERWTRSNCGVDYPSWGDDVTSDLSARDMAKIGLLMLNGGVREGRRIVSEEYVKAGVAPSAANSGYGFLWWLSGAGFHAQGFGGQELNVYPAQNAVAVIQATVTPSSKTYSDVCENILTLL